MKRILVLDGDMNSTLAIVRSLGSQDWSVDVASPVHHGIASHSKFAGNKLLYADPLKSETEFLDWAKKILASNEYALVIPVTERTLVPLMKIRSSAGAEKLAMAGNESLEVVLDKTKTTELAQQLNIALPSNQVIANQDDLKTFIEQQQNSAMISNFPLVIKPGRSIGSNNQGRKKLEVQYAFSLAEAENKIDALLNFGEVIVQEYFQGQGLGVNVLAKDGEVLYAFQHQRVHELPLTGGASCLRHSTALNPILLDAATRMMKAIKWTGVAMVEFKWNPQTAKFILVEINGRFWGSLPLAVAAGADFPGMLVELLVDGKISPRPAYKTDFYGRNLAMDLQWYELAVRGHVPAKFKGVWQDKKRLFKDAALVFSDNHAFDVQRLNDPLPGVMDFLRVAKSYVKRVQDALKHRRILRARRDEWNSNGQRRLQKAKSVLFVCYGNINRSALSERYFNQTFPQSSLIVKSAGFHPNFGRAADPVMNQEARARGINMNDWSSTTVSEELLQSSDIIFVMENSHWMQIKSEYPSHISKTFLMGFANPRVVLANGEIEDPYGKPRNIYQKCISEVCESIEGLIKILKKNR